MMEDKSPRVGLQTMKLLNAKWDWFCPSSVTRLASSIKEPDLSLVLSIVAMANNVIQKQGLRVLGAPLLNIDQSTLIGKRFPKGRKCVRLVPLIPLREDQAYGYHCPAPSCERRPFPPPLSDPGSRGINGFESPRKISMAHASLLMYVHSEVGDLA
ncbi:hypothetical protein VNO77_23024 [Canavalia gladiata]|uniref:Uncharacterized protein n=1 Tax=Canavalia gladiata TaxID=3824 RepID=A0AAN9L4K3_CANGL